MRTADALTAGVLVLLAAVVVVEGLQLGVGWGTDGPQPGFFVMYLGIALGVSALVLLGQMWARARVSSAGPFLTREQAIPVVKVLAPAIGLVVLTQVIGLYVAGALYLGAYMRWIGRHSWLLTIILAIAIPVATFVVFEMWFLVPMPKGPLEAALGY